MNTRGRARTHTASCIGRCVTLAVLVMLACATGGAVSQQPHADHQPQDPAFATAIALDDTALDGAALGAAQQRVFRAALDQIHPSIVRIDTVGGAQPVTRSGEQAQAAGFRLADGPTTGVVWSADGYVLSSSFNFVRTPTVITVTLHDGRSFVAQRVAQDHVAQLMLLKISASDLQPPRLASLTDLAPGDWALAAGYGLGSARPALSVGVVGALQRIDGIALQTDARTSPANYGGPLFDVQGRLLGISVPLSPMSDGALAGIEWYDSGIGFAVRHDFIAQRMAALQAGRSLQRGLIGVNLEHGRGPAALASAASTTQPVADGLRVAGEPAGPAAAAGVREGDLLTHVNDVPVPTITAFRRQASRHTPGEEVTLRFLRDGATRQVTLTLAARDDFATPASSQPR